MVLLALMLSAGQFHRWSLSFLCAVFREYDVPYHVRVSIDLKINVSRWYTVVVHSSAVVPDIQLREDLLDLPVCCHCPVMIADVLEIQD